LKDKLKFHFTGEKLQEKKMRRIFIITSLVLIFTGTPVHGESVSVLAGFQTVSFGGDVGKFWDIPSGPGLVLNIAFPSFIGVPFDLNIGQRKVNESGTNDEVKYNWIEAGPRFFLGREDDRIRPEFVAGAGIYNLDVGDISFDQATGIYFGFGFEDAATQHLTGRFQVKLVYWQTDPGSIDAPSLNFTLMYGYRF
jgi:hypothetical protein